MRITAERFTLEISQSEMWDLAHVLRRDLQARADDRIKLSKLNKTDGKQAWAHFCQEKGSEMHMFETVASHLGRWDYYNDEIQLIEKRIRELN